MVIAQIKITLKSAAFPALTTLHEPEAAKDMNFKELLP